MASTLVSTNASLQSTIEQDGYAFVHGRAMRDLLIPFGSVVDWETFAESWSHLELDTYMADGGRYRQRRYAAYEASPEGIERKPHQAHYQTVEYNRLHGGISRWFEPISQETAEGPTMRTILGFCHALFSRLAPTVPVWHVEVHQFRIEARSSEQGRPTPEGQHRDGVDYVLVLLVNRRNIASGVTTIHALDGRALGHFTLTSPFDAALVDDQRVSHGVTPVEPIDSSLPAYRDVLVVTFHRAGP